MNADFLDAHHRHLRDADCLFSASHLANADHLYGMAAECGLKRLMIAFGMQTNDTGAPENRKKDWIHAEKVWVRLTLPPENVSLAEWFNSDKENENDKDIKGQVHA
ncbi:hypothetical protein RCH06_001594, partial [Polaromonas sp. CG_9.5]|uniref:hypothetical protein n=1 Tax=Polaromonas sp. CG_9.5 TaxID=3071705 RepID=UPI002DFB53BF|nr:hypothetical protein [Polaromonas sp. CG_9.5]